MLMIIVLLERIQFRTCQMEEVHRARYGEGHRTVPSLVDHFPGTWVRSPIWMLPSVIISEFLPEFSLYRHD